MAVFFMIVIRWAICRCDREISPIQLWGIIYYFLPMVLKWDLVFTICESSKTLIGVKLWQKY